ncbi:hypothetical protein GCM10018952_11270 [Streptosporangium vulgare]
MTLHHADHGSGRPSVAKDETVAADAPARELGGDPGDDLGGDPRGDLGRDLGGASGGDLGGDLGGEPGSDPGSDEVDLLVAAWRQERPDLDVEPLQVLSRVSRLARHLDRARRASFAEHGLETWEFDVLTALRRAGDPYEMSPGALLRATLVTSGTMTNRIDRLAAAGLVRRRPDPEDRRGVLVSLTDAGRTRVDGAFADLLRRERDLLSGLGKREQQALAGLLRTLLVPFDATETGVR